MSTPARKRKVSSSTPSMTLFQFFKTASAEPLQKKAKAPQSARKSLKNVEEVIIIDSDSDDGAAAAKRPVASRKRNNASNGRSEEVIDISMDSDDSARRVPKVRSPPAKLKAPPLDKRESFGYASTVLRASSPAPDPRNASFGAASTLLRDEPKEEQSFGRPHLLTSIACSSSTKLEDLASMKREEADCSPPAVEGSLIDDWAMGDDEMNVLDPDDDRMDEDEEVEDPLDDPATPDDALLNCPICGKGLSNFFISQKHDHISTCMDAAGEISFAPVSPLAKPRVPLSALQASPSKRGPNAFSVLMSSHKENEAWKEATIVEDRAFKATANNRRKAPFYKVLQGMPIAVDAFRYGTIPGVTAYFLTHAHSDHYTNLSGNWKSGPIYCSEGTAKLVIHMLGVDPKWVHALPMDKPTVIPNTSGVEVTLIEANHCPGSCLFFYEGRQTIDAGDSAFKSPYIGSTRTFRYLHCGDFRASPQHVLHPAVKGKRLDHVYLDTTYLDPKYCFPPQPLVISACADLVERIVSGSAITDAAGNAARPNGTMHQYFSVDHDGTDKDKETDLSVVRSNPGKTLVVVGTYSIGKERIVKAIAKRLQTKIYCDSRKAAILRCQCDAELDALLTKNSSESCVHIVPLSVITSDRLKDYFDKWKGGYSKVVGFRPTGWTYATPAGSDTLPPVASVIQRDQRRTFSAIDLRPQRNSTSTIMLYGVPYSEHSSFFELSCFALSCDWGKMIATVNVGSQKSRAKMARWVEKWEAERRKRRAEGTDQATGGVVAYRRQDYW